MTQQALRAMTAGQAGHIVNIGTSLAAQPVAGLPPLLEACGRFVVDVCTTEVLRAPAPGAFNRLFTIRFPSRQKRDAFFADHDYVAIRTRLFEPSVSGTVWLGDYAVV
jgi:hypothetical protein